MPQSSFSLARLLGLSALFLGLSLACGGGGSNPPPGSSAAPDASRSSVAVDRASGVRADGADRVTITVTVRDSAGKPLSGRTVLVEVPGDGTSVTQPSGATNASGVATASVISTQAGARQVTASV
jgi:adhesin/invasin